jgi:hypothetical protein
MIPNRLNPNNKFDEMLGRTLQSSSEPVPADFTARMLNRIRRAEEQKILARVILQERLALAGSIMLGVAAVVAAAAFPDVIASIFNSIADSFSQRGTLLVDKFPQTLEALQGQWQLYTILAVVCGFGVYSLLNLLVSDRLRMP